MRARAFGNLGMAWLLLGFLAPACSTAIKERAAIDPAKEAGPRPINRESPHVELKLSATVVRPGVTVFAKAYGRGDLKGGWRCTSQLWSDVEGGTLPLEGVPPRAPCGEVGETWIWPEGRGKQYRFTSPGQHEVCVTVHDRQGWVIGTRQCVPVNVVRTE